MDHTRRGAHLVQVTRLRFVNAFVVLEDDGATVIHTTLPRGADTILTPAEAIGAPVRRLAVTHAHGDHVGSLDALAERLDGVEIAFPAREARLMAGDRSLDPGEPQWPRPRRAYGEDELPTGEDAADPGRSHRRPPRLARGGRRGGPHTGAGRLPRHPRPDAPVRGRLRDVVRAGHLGQAHAALAHAGDRDLAPPDGARECAPAAALEPARLAPGHGRVVECPAAVMDQAL